MHEIVRYRTREVFHLLNILISILNRPPHSGTLSIAVGDNLAKFETYVSHGLLSEPDLVGRLCLEADATKLEDFSKDGNTR
jgi:hypothetical protein